MATVRGRVTLVGEKRVKRLLALFDDRVNRHVKECVQTSALNIQREAKKRAPVNKMIGIGGQLRASIRVDIFDDGFTADVLTDLEYAQFVEFGTGQRGAASELQKGMELPPDYSYGDTAGATAQPYLFPSWDEELPNFEKCLLGGIKSAARLFNR